MLSYEFEFNGFRFNDMASIRTGKYVSLTGVDGFSSPEIVHSEDVLVGQHGIVDYYSFLGKRILTFEGGIVGRTEAEMLEKLAEFTQAFSIPSVPIPTRTGYHYLKIIKDGEVSKRINAKVNLLPRIDKQLHVHRMRRFFVELRCPNPRFESISSRTASLDKAKRLGTLPMILPQALDGEGEWINEVDVLNNGNFGALPIITINGPCVDPILWNVSYPDIFQQFNVTLAEGESIVVDTANGTAVHSDGSNMLPNETNTSHWFVIFPGTNTLRFTSSDVNYGAGSIDISWRDTWNSLPR